MFNTKHDRKYLLNNIYNLLYVTTPRMLQSNLKYHIIFVQLLLIITFYTLLCYNQKGNKLPIFDPHRPITLPNLVRALANIPQQKDVNKKNRKRKKDKAISSNLVGQGFKHFSGSYLSNDYHEDDKYHKDKNGGIKTMHYDPPGTPIVRGKLLSLKKDTAPPIPARGIMKLRINKKSSRSLEKIPSLGFSYVNNEMLEEDEQAAAWVKRNRNCDLFMKRVDPQVGGDTYSIHEEARKADTSSHMFSVHYQGCLYMPNGSVWDGNKLLRVRTLAAIKKRKAKKRRKKERKEQRRKDREEKMRGV